ncbi:hypothetical protein [Porphyromonas macacae]|uniref:hypothetical protein n=1 Tax=Porphyromonas macacae TaxID=28115 RepID=UPI00036D6F41|nr:hypothetical protein [Porphyromonas macacae]
MNYVEDRLCNKTRTLKNPKRVSACKGKQIFVCRKTFGKKKSKTKKIFNKIHPFLISPYRESMSKQTTLVRIAIAKVEIIFIPARDQNKHFKQKDKNKQTKNL